MLTNFLKNPSAALKLMNELMLKNGRQQLAPHVTTQSDIEAEPPALRGEQNEIRAVAVMLSAEGRKSSVKHSKQLKHRKDRNNRKNEDQK